MAEITNPHDRFFREVFSRLAWSRDFLRTQLPPAIVETLVLETLELRSGSFLDEELQQYFSDLLFRVRLRTGRDAYVHVLLEHKSYIEHFVALQLLRYKVEVWEQIRAEAKAAAKGADPKQKRREPLKLPPIFPLLVYQGTRKWTVSQHFTDLIDSSEEWQPYVPDFQYAVVSVTDIRETEHFDAVLFRAAIRLMRHIFDPDLADKLPQIWAEFRDLAWGQETQGFLIVMLTYITSATDVSNAELVRSLETSVPEQEETLMATLARQWIQEGITQGIEQGLLSSIRTGLRTRFGPAGEQVMEHIADTHDPAKLQQLVSALFEVNTLAEFQERCRIILADDNSVNGVHLN